MAVYLGSNQVSMKGGQPIESGGSSVWNDVSGNFTININYDTFVAISDGTIVCVYISGSDPTDLCDPNNDPILETSYYLYNSNAAVINILYDDEVVEFSVVYGNHYFTPCSTPYAANTPWTFSIAFPIVN